MNQYELNDKFIDVCGSGDLELAKKYHKMGAYIHAGDDMALRWSAENGHLHVVKYLIKNGADIHADDDWALCWAAYYSHLHVVNYLREIDAGKKWNCYECIVKTTCSELCEAYLK